MCFSDNKNEREKINVEKFEKEMIFNLAKWCSLFVYILYLQDKESMLRVMKVVDKANGYVFGDLEERNMQQMMSCAVGAEFEYEKIQTVREKYMDTDTGDVENDDGGWCVNMRF